MLKEDKVMLKCTGERKTWEFTLRLMPEIEPSILVLRQSTQLVKIRGPDKMPPVINKHVSKIQRTIPVSNKENLL